MKSRTSTASGCCGVTSSAGSSLSGTSTITSRPTALTVPLCKIGACLRLSKDTRVRSAPAPGARTPVSDRPHPTRALVRHEGWLPAPIRMPVLQCLSSARSRFQTASSKMGIARSICQKDNRLHPEAHDERIGVTEDWQVIGKGRADYSQGFPHHLDRRTM